MSDIHGYSRCGCKTHTNFTVDQFSIRCNVHGIAWNKLEGAFRDLKEELSHLCESLQEANNAGEKLKAENEAIITANNLLSAELEMYSELSIDLANELRAERDYTDSVVRMADFLEKHGGDFNYQAHGLFKKAKQRQEERKIELSKKDET